MKEIYDTAVIGCGRMGGTIDDEMGDHPRWRGPYSHGAGYAACPRTRIVAATDPVEEKRLRFGERYGVPRSHLFADSQEMLANVPLDIVSVTTHAPQHCECVLAAAESGVKAIFCEKPLAATLVEADQMVAAAEQRELVTAVGTIRRWSTLWNKVKGLIDAGEAGTVSHIVQHSGGRLLHTESHFFDLGRYLLGNAEPDWAVGHLLGENISNDDGTAPDRSGHGYVHFKTGAEYFLTAPGCMYHETTIVCANAVFRSINNGSEMRMWVNDTDSAIKALKEIPFEMPEPTGATLIGIDEIVKCLDEGGNTRCTFRDGLIALEMAFALHLSHRRGNARVDWPIEDRDMKVLAR